MGSSKWNPIEHRLFSQISSNWEATPLTSYELMVNYIRTTQTGTGLKVCARLFPKGYQKGETISDLKCDNFSLPLTRLYPAGTTPLLHTKCETILARLLRREATHWNRMMS